MHQCQECGLNCYCDGHEERLDDYEECTHYLTEMCNPEDSTVDGWLCSCSHFNPHIWHCEVCGGDPPTGPCRCDVCWEIDETAMLFEMGDES